MLYNYGLHEDGEHTLHHERYPCGAGLECCTLAAMERFESLKLTIYELAFPAAALGHDALEAELTLGFSICVNDGDSVEAE